MEKRVISTELVEEDIKIENNYTLIFSQKR